MDIANVIGNRDSQKEGEWIEYKEGVRFLLVYSDSKKPRTFFMNGFSKLRRKAHGKLPAAEKQAELTLDMLVEHVVKDWEGLEQRDPNSTPEEPKMIPFPYSKQNCRTLLEQSTVLRDFVAQEAADLDNFGGNVDAAEEESNEEDGPKGELKSGPPVAA